MCLSGGSPPSPPTPGGTCAPGAPVPCDRIRLVQVVERVTNAAGTDVDQAIAGRNQFINVPAAHGHPEFGRAINFRARVQWVSGSTSSLSGQTVYWYFVPKHGNRAGLRAGLQAGLGAAGTVRTTSTTDAQGWTSVVAFIPSQYGGDQFEVFATDNAAFTGGLSAGKYTVWRRLNYELDCMTRPGGHGTYSNRADTAGMTAKLRALFLQLSVSGTDASPAHVRMIGENDVSAWAANIRDGTGAPRYFHLLLIDTIAWDPTATTRDYVLGAGHNQIVLPASTYLLKAGAWFVSATFTQGAHHGAIPEANFTLSEAGSPSAGNDRFVITVSWAGYPVNPANAVRLRLVFTNWTEGSGLQVPNGPATIIGIRWRERAHRATPANIGLSTLNTMLHEPGHAMGLAPKTLPDGAANADQYNQAGSHCHAGHNSCVMYEANSTHVDFDAHCGDGLRGRDLSSLPVDGNDPF